MARRRSTRRRWLSACGCVCTVGTAGCMRTILEGDLEEDGDVNGDGGSDGDGDAGGDGDGDDADGDDGADDFPTGPLTWAVPPTADGLARTTVELLSPAVGSSLGTEVGLEEIDDPSELADREPHGHEFGTVVLSGQDVWWLRREGDEPAIAELTPIANVGAFGAVIVLNREIAEEFGLDASAEGVGHEILEELYTPHSTPLGYVAVEGNRIVVEVLREEHGLEIDGVAYDSEETVTRAVDAGEVPAGIVSSTTAAAVDAAVPAVNLTGLDLPGIDADPIGDRGPELGWLTDRYLTVLAPPETPTDVRESLSSAIQESVGSDDLREWAERTAVDLGYGDLEDAADVLETATEVYDRLEAIGASHDDAGDHDHDAGHQDHDGGG